MNSTIQPCFDGLDKYLVRAKDDSNNGPIVDLVNTKMFGTTVTATVVGAGREANGLHPGPGHLLLLEPRRHLPLTLVEGEAE